MEVLGGDYRFETRFYLDGDRVLYIRGGGNGLHPAPKTPSWCFDGAGGVACTRFRRHRVRCFDGAGGGSWKGGSLRESSSLRRCA
jgi:hypothetical protein